MKSLNPSTGTLVWEVEETPFDDIDRMFDRSRDVFQAWSGRSFNDRQVIVERFGQIVMDQQEVLAEAISQEMGKPLWESRLEVKGVINKIPVSIEAYQQRCQLQINILKKGTSVTRHKPLGVMVVLGPFNFPAHLPNGHMVPAFLAGNTVIFKPSDHTPYVGSLLVKFWKEAGLPDGVLQIVQGGSQRGRYLAEHSGLDGLLFTGSSAVGKQLSTFFGAQPSKLLALEMGGNNPLLVMDVADVKAAALIALQSSVMTTGQRCSCARRLVVLDTPQSQLLLDTIQSMMSSLVIGSYFHDPEPFMGPLISEDACHNMLLYQEKLIKNGATVLIKSIRMDGNGFFITPALLDVTAVSDRLDDECFGPLLQVIRVSSFDEAVMEANRTRYGLAASILSDCKEDYELFLQRSRAGVVNWNMPTSGAAGVAPFGGIGDSGNYRPSAYYAADYCSYPVASIENEQLSLPESLPPGLYFE